MANKTSKKKTKDVVEEVTKEAVTIEEAINEIQSPDNIDAIEDALNEETVEEGGKVPDVEAAVGEEPEAEAITPEEVEDKLSDINEGLTSKLEDVKTEQEAEQAVKEALESVDAVEKEIQSTLKANKPRLNSRMTNMWCGVSID